jgi:hypothetical protein
MNRTQLRDNRGLLIGWIDTIHGGRKQIRDNKGTLLGWYDATSDRTTCAKTGRWIGMGEQLTALLQLNR